MKVIAARFWTGGFFRRRIDIVKMKLRPEGALDGEAHPRRQPPTAMASAGGEPFRTPFEEDKRVLETPALSVGPNANASSGDARTEQARSDERGRLARDLHDGMLQTLTGATLQLEVLSRMLERDPEAARARLSQIKDLIAEEQTALRSWIRYASTVASTVPDAELGVTLANLCRRVEWQWGLHVQLTMVHGGSISKPLAYEVYRLVQESLANIGRHASARSAHVDLRTSSQRIQVVIADDGCGFPFGGRYDLAALNAAGLGPRSLKERVGSLGGDLVLTSTPSGSRIAIGLPLTATRAAGGRARSQER